jgi:hypothetical protein
MYLTVGNVGVGINVVYLIQGFGLGSRTFGTAIKLSTYLDTGRSFENIACYPIVHLSINECRASFAFTSVFCAVGCKFFTVAVSERLNAFFLGSGAKSAGISLNARTVTGRSFNVIALKPLVSGGIGGGVAS